MFSHPLSLWGIKGHSTWGPTDRGCQPTPQSSAQSLGLWDAVPTLGKETTRSAVCSCNERLGDNCSSCHPRIQSPDFWFASPCIAGEKAKESFYSLRKFGRRASEQSSNPESGSPERALGEHVSTLQRVDHGGWSKSSVDGESADGGWTKCSSDGESAERVSACRANGVSGRSTESTSAGGDEGVCVERGENGVSAGVQSRSSRSTESGSTCGVRGVEGVTEAERRYRSSACWKSSECGKAALRPGCLKSSGCGDRGRHFATVAQQLCSKLPYNSQREMNEGENEGEENEQNKKERESKRESENESETQQH